MLREERDDMLELCTTLAHTSADPYTVYGHRARVTTYGHLTVINRVDMLKCIDSRRLSPHHQRQITNYHAVRLLTMADGS
jgi:hypothetical protein